MEIMEVRIPRNLAMEVFSRKTSPKGSSCAYKIYVTLAIWLTVQDFS